MRKDKENKECVTWEMEPRAYFARVQAFDRSTSNRKNGSASLQPTHHTHQHYHSNEGHSLCRFI